jgi:hypothetical protein
MWSVNGMVADATTDEGRIVTVTVTDDFTFYEDAQGVTATEYRFDFGYSGDLLLLGGQSATFRHTGSKWRLVSTSYSGYELAVLATQGEGPNPASIGLHPSMKDAPYGNSQELGDVIFYSASDYSEYQAAAVGASSDGATEALDSPGMLQLKTTTPGSYYASSKWRVRASGDFEHDPSYGSGRIRSKLLNVGGFGYGPPNPDNYYWLASNYDPMFAANNAVLPVAGTMYNVMVDVPKSGSLDGVVTCVTTAGSGLTSGQCFVAVYEGSDSSATLVAQSDDASGDWASTGMRHVYFTGAPTLNPGPHIISFWFNGTTGPTFACAANNANLVNPEGQARFTSSGTSKTTTAPATVGALTNIGPSWWAAITYSWPG